MGERWWPDEGDGGKRGRRLADANQAERLVPSGRVPAGGFSGFPVFHKDGVLDGLVVAIRHLTFGTETISSESTQPI
jgi:hypothetical protein